MQGACRRCYRGRLGAQTPTARLSDCTAISHTRASHFERERWWGNASRVIIFASCPPFVRHSRMSSQQFLRHPDGRKETGGSSGRRREPALRNLYRTREGGRVKQTESLGDQEFTALPEEAVALLVDERQKEAVSIPNVLSLLRFAKRYKGEFREDFRDTALALVSKFTDEQIMNERREAQEILRTLAELGSLQEGFQLLERLLAVRIVPDEPALLALLHACTEQKQLNLALELVRFLRDHFDGIFKDNGEKLQRCLLPVLDVCLRMKRTDGVCSLMHYVATIDAQTPTPHWHEYNDGETVEQDPPRAFVFFRYICRVCIPTYRQVRLRRRRGPSSGSSSPSSSPSAVHDTSSMFDDGMTEAGEEDAVQQEEVTVERDADKEGRADAASQSPAADINPTEEGWMPGYGTCADLLALFKELSGQGFNCAYGYYKVLQALADEGDLLQAHEVMNLVEPNFLTYHVLAQLALCEGNDVAQAIAHLVRACEDVENRKSLSNFRDSRGINSALSNPTHYSHINNPQPIDYEPLHRAISRGGEAILVGVGRCLDGLIEAGLRRRAAADEAATGGGGGSSAVVVDTSTMLHLVAEVESRTGVKANAHIYSVLIKGYLHNGDFDGALAMLEAAKTHGAVDFVSYRMLVSYLVRNENGQRPDMVLRVLKEAFEICIEMRPWQQEALFGDEAQMWASRGDLRAAFRVVERIKRHGLRVSGPLYKCLLKHCQRLGDARRARQLQDMILQNQESNVVVTKSEQRLVAAKRSLLDFLQKGASAVSHAAKEGSSEKGPGTK